MKKLTFIFGAIILLNLSCKEHRELETKVKTIELHYIAWACQCANWATAEDIRKYQNKGNELADHCIFIEPAEPTLALDEHLLQTNTTIRLTGQFYKDKGYPANQNFPDGKPDKARVFLYTKYEVINIPGPIETTDSIPANNHSSK